MNRLAIGSILSRSFSLLGKNLVPFGAVVAVLHFPLLPLRLYQQSLTVGGPVPQEVSLRFVAAEVLLSMTIGAITCSALTHAVLSRLDRDHGAPMSIADSIRTAMRRLGRVIGVSLAVGVLTSVGMLACCIPGIILSCRYAVAAPAVVVEGHGVGGSLRRSVELTAGSRWDIFAVYMVTGLIIGAVGGIPATLSVVILGPLGFDVMHVASLVFVWLCGLVGSVFWLLVQVTTYHDLRLLRDGPTRDEVARAFD